MASPTATLTATPIPSMTPVPTPTRTPWHLPTSLPTFAPHPPPPPPPIVWDPSYLISYWLIGPILCIVIFIIGFIGWKLYLCIRNCRRKRIEKDRKTKQSRSLNLSDNGSISNFLESLKNEDPTPPSLLSVTSKSFTIDFAFNHLSLRLRSDNSLVLSDVSGKIKHGRMTAIMGPSGSGKTTFMTTLAGKAFYGKMEGQLLINDKAERISKYRNDLGFVPQEDIMLRCMTVRETLQFSADTRLPGTTPRSMKKKIVDEVLELLDLVHVQHSIIGDENKRGISGGQRKRVNIGMELVADPTVILLDEPTSGLDASSSMSICGCLRRISSLGLTIIAVIHQPRFEIFRMFHDVVLLGKGGKTIYLGPTEDCLEYFESLGFECPQHSNPADFFLDIISNPACGKDQTIKTSDDLVKKWSERQKRLSSSSKREEEDSEEERENIDEGMNPLYWKDIWEGIQWLWSAQKRGFRSFRSGLRKLITSETKEEELNSSFENVPILSDIQIKGSEDLSIRSERKLNRDPGTGGIFAGFFLLCLFFPFLVPVSTWSSSASLARRYGGILGALCALYILSVFWFAAFACAPALLVPNIIWNIFLFIVVLILARRYHKKSDTPYLGMVCGGSIFSFAYVWWIWNRDKITIHKRLAAITGTLFFVNILILICSTPFTLACCNDNGTGSISCGNWSIIAYCLYFVLCFPIFLLLRRIHLLPTIRHPPSSFRQIPFFAARGLVQFSRAWLATLFDFVLVIFAGAFVGVVYYHSPYIPPIVDSFPKKECLFDWKVCKILSLPQADPLSGMASLTTLSLGLSAVASSLRIFGDETVVFRREAEAGCSTEAYYVGKTISHFPTIFLAPFLFTIFFYSIALPEAPFYQYYAMYFLIYFAVAGLAYLISLVAPPSMAQLAGVLSILSFFMFAGASPTLPQLKANELVPYAMYYLAYFSLFRYAQELCFLIGITPYDPGPGGIFTYFGYSLDDKLMCWVAMVILGIIFRFLAYIALVIRERKR